MAKVRLTYDTPEVQAILDSVAGKADIFTGTTYYWTRRTGYVPPSGTIIVYTDYKTKVVNGVTVDIPGIKIGSGNAYVQDLAFVGEGEQADWNQSDSTATDYIRNRTHYTYLTPTTISQPKIGFSGTPGTTSSALKALDFWLYGTEDHFEFDYETSSYVIFKLPGYYLASDTQKRDIQLKIQIGGSNIYGGVSGTSTSLSMPMGPFISGGAFVNESPINFGPFEVSDDEYYPIAHGVETVVKLDAKYLPANIVGKLNVDDDNEVANETLIFNRD